MPLLSAQGEHILAARLKSDLAVDAGQRDSKRSKFEAVDVGLADGAASGIEENPSREQRPSNNKKVGSAELKRNIVLEIVELAGRLGAAGRRPVPG